MHALLAPATRCRCGDHEGGDVLTRRPDLGDMALVGARFLAGLRESA